MLEVVEPALLTTLQDGGRRGWQAFGVPISGPMDAYALHAANLLVCNPPGAAAVEVGFSAAVFMARQPCLVALTGAGFSLEVAGFEVPLWTSVYVRANHPIHIKKTGPGNWAYLAVNGGIESPVALGSRSTYLRASLGAHTTRALQAGDVLPTGSTRPGLVEWAARRIFNIQVHYSTEATIQIIPGPQISHFTAAGLQTLLSSAYSINPASDRTGYRLDGPAIERARMNELISEGMARGCIQIPASGLPIIMQADCPTTGGYPKIAAVISADQPVLAQVPVGSGQIHFEETSIEQAQARYRAMMTNLAGSIIQPEIDDYSW
jgi:antagonist of KipI